jgi:hypothetical protein
MYPLMMWELSIFKKYYCELNKNVMHLFVETVETELYCTQRTTKNKDGTLLNKDLAFFKSC